MFRFFIVLIFAQENAAGGEEGVQEGSGGEDVQRDIEKNFHKEQIRQDALITLVAISFKHNKELRERRIMRETKL